MHKPPATYEVYFETGRRRVFAGAVEWPGWCRSGRDESAALETLVAYGPRYARAVHTAYPGLELAASASELVITERLEGNATTDFGAPGAIPAADQRTLAPAELERLTTLLQACWQAFDAAVLAARGKALRKGPRGGGRELSAIVQHQIDANRAYLSKMAWKPDLGADANPEQQLSRMLDEVLSALRAGAADELPRRGPRGGKLWAPRYFARRVAWHMLDHAWEIEDRVRQHAQPRP
ncbi:MAG: hypothetical protein PVJ26_16400 [Anaerolineae bacterium]